MTIFVSKTSCLVQNDGKFYLSFYDMSLIDIEHILEMNLIFIKKLFLTMVSQNRCTLLESVVQYLAINILKIKYEEKSQILFLCFGILKIQNKQKSLIQSQCLMVISLFKIDILILKIKSFQKKILNICIVFWRVYLVKDLKVLGKSKWVL